MTETPDPGPIVRLRRCVLCGDSVPSTDTVSAAVLPPGNRRGQVCLRCLDRRTRLGMVVARPGDPSPLP